MSGKMNTMKKGDNSTAIPHDISDFCVRNFGDFGKGVGAIIIPLLHTVASTRRG